MCLQIAASSPPIREEMKSRDTSGVTGGYLALPAARCLTPPRSVLPAEGQSSTGTISSGNLNRNLYL